MSSQIYTPGADPKLKLSKYQANVKYASFSAQKLKCSSCFSEIQVLKLCARLFSAPAEALTNDVLLFVFLFAANFAFLKAQIPNCNAKDDYLTETKKI